MRICPQIRKLKSCKVKIMRTHADKSKKDKSRSVANAVASKQSGESAFQFADNRPESIAQRNLQAGGSTIRQRSGHALD